MQDCIMFKLEPSFQKKVFREIIEKYGGSIKASNILKIPASSIRCYKNLYSKTIPKDIIKKIISLKIISEQDLKKNTLKKFHKSEL